MSDEDAFLVALSQNPADDVCRLVFADWLEEREQFDKATYLRLVCRAVETLGTPDEASVIDQMLGACKPPPWEWRNAAAGRFDLVLVDYSRSEKILLIKLLRQLFGWGLAEVAGEVERLPNRLLTWSTFEDMICTRDMLRDVSSIAFQAVASSTDTAASVKRPGWRYKVHASFSWWYADVRPGDETQSAIQRAVCEFVRGHGPDYPARVTSRSDWGVEVIVAEDVPLQVVTRLFRTLDHKGREIADRFKVQFWLSNQPNMNHGG